MKAIFTWLITAMILTITLQSEAQSWQWGKRGGSAAGDVPFVGGYTHELVTDMATDQHGNVYVVSVINAGSKGDVDGHLGLNTWNRVAVASWNCSGEFRWLKTFGGGATASAVALRTDTLGGVYIAGAMPSMSSLGGLSYFDTDTTLPISGMKAVYIVKYDTSGAFQWLKQPQADTITSSFGGVFDMDISPSGDVYLYSLLVPGVYDNGAFAIADTGMYVWKINGAGVFQSLVKLDVTVSGEGSLSPSSGYTNLGPLYAHFKRDHESGRYYLAGKRDEDYGTLAFASTSIAPKSMYVTAFNSDGNVAWTKQQDTVVYGCNVNQRPVIAGDQIYIGGSGLSGNGFGGFTFVNEFGLSGIPFIVTLDSEGNAIWATNGSAISATIANGLAYTNNTINQAGRYGGLFWDSLSVSTIPGKNYIYLARFNATTGAIIGLDSIASSSLNNYATAMAADNNNNLYIGGQFEQYLYVGPDTLSKIGGPYDWFVAKFGTANCNCAIPTASFSYTTSGTAINFSYTGSTDYTSISWDFGDGATAATPNPSHTFTDTGSHTVCVTVTNDCGSNLYCLEVAGATGIESTGSAAAVKVYPNPTTNSITIEGAGSGTKLSLYSITGALQLEQTLRSSLRASINISHLPDGVYLLQFTDTQGRKGMTKVVKQ